MEAITWSDYQKALINVKLFEKQRSEIQSKRRSVNWNRTFNDIVWEKRESLSKMQYEIRSLTNERKEYLGSEFLDKLINDEKARLLIIRKRALEKKIKEKLNNNKT